ncbi:GNAT family N-acetyltransferase [Streptomyces sp. MUM 203J]|uniref:GNAT family N-acetyltransferase n=1 Tax=Streptomyces sp. MUM 203J TaxID=2791990 RepID=UPI001F03A16D|nr:GNAT family N-acetyltransferase [Streptomyces sp. MUM 203J]MCH0539050.1 GNAT family N-acetyltransferase [Streptomyces sp. MUM 203J]
MTTAGWELSYDVTAFQRQAAAYLESHPARCTALLTTAENLRVHGPRSYGGGDPRFGWWRATDGGPVEAAFVYTPPSPPLLGPMPDRAARELAVALRLTGADLTGVKGVDGSAQAFAETWTDDAPRTWAVAFRLRLLRLAELAPPRPAPPGTGRRATPGDVPMAAAWMRAFIADTGQETGPDTDFTAHVTRRIANGGLYLWEADGRPVSMAAHSLVVAGQSRVGPVYTPRECRGRGYGAAATAAATRSALTAGARQVLLFADAANPTSNALYERLGYRLLGHHVDIDFA